MDQLETGDVKNLDTSKAITCTACVVQKEPRPFEVIYDDLLKMSNSRCNTSTSRRSYVGNDSPFPKEDWL
ncbi:hypothetical protein E2C01_058860 [Portunus trituberculatus]|uniref:Uncharacterized protein n=1 Tax=Portunus trituberculatus TaxID=210409 RepID=A0A5B7GXJ1_PORTR|nr:hypothetical protein [Portunus trituberculatus]